MSKLDPKAYAAGEKAGREGKSANENPHVDGGLEIAAQFLFPGVGTLLSKESPDKASSWAQGHNTGVHNKKK